MEADTGISKPPLSLSLFGFVASDCLVSVVRRSGYYKPGAPQWRLGQAGRGEKRLDLRGPKAKAGMQSCARPPQDLKSWLLTA